MKSYDFLRTVMEYGALFVGGISVFFVNDKIRDVSMFNDKYRFIIKNNIDVLTGFLLLVLVTTAVTLVFNKIFGYKKYITLRKQLFIYILKFFITFLGDFTVLAISFCSVMKDF